MRERALVRRADGTENPRAAEDVRERGRVLEGRGENGGRGGGGCCHTTWFRSVERIAESVPAEQTRLVEPRRRREDFVVTARRHQDVFPALLVERVTHALRQLDDAAHGLRVLTRVRVRAALGAAERIRRRHLRRLTRAALERLRRGERRGQARRGDVPGEARVDDARFGFGRRVGDSVERVSERPKARVSELREHDPGAVRVADALERARRVARRALADARHERGGVHFVHDFFLRPHQGDELVHPESVRHVLHGSVDGLRRGHTGVRTESLSRVQLGFLGEQTRVVVLHADLVRHDAVVELPQVRGGDVRAVVDAAVVPQKLFRGHLAFHLRVVRVRVEHDHGKRQHVRGVRRFVRARVAHAEALGELLHQAVDLLGLARQTEPRQERADRLIERHLGKVHRVHVRVHHRQTTLVSFTEVLADGGFVQIVRVAQKRRHLRRRLSAPGKVLHRRDALLRLRVEQRDRGLILRLARFHGLDAGQRVRRRLSSGRIRSGSGSRRRSVPRRGVVSLCRLERVSVVSSGRALVGASHPVAQRLQKHAQALQRLQTQRLLSREVVRVRRRMRRVRRNGRRG